MVHNATGTHSPAHRLDEAAAPAPVGKTLGSNGKEVPILSIRCISELAELESVAEKWNDLAASCSATIYQTYEWCTLWWKHLGRTPQRSIHVLLFLEGETLRGLAPMFLRRVKSLGKVRFHRLGMLGSGIAFNRSFGFFLDDGPSDYLDILAAPGYESAVAGAFASYLTTASPPIDEVELLNVADNSFVRTVLVPFFVQRGSTCMIYRAELCSRVRIPESFDKFKSGLSANARRRMSQVYKAAHEVLTLTDGTKPENFEFAFSEMIKMHQRRWNDIGYAGFFSKPSFTAFQKEVAETFLRKGWLWFKLASFEGRSAGARLGFVFNGAIYDYLSGLDTHGSSAKYRPGLSLLVLMLEDGIAQGMHTLDLLRGDESYKFEFEPRSFHNSDVILRPGDPGMGVELMYDVFRGLQFIGFLADREFHLLRVQMRVKGFVKGSIYYVGFRWKRMLSKLRRSGGPEHVPSN